jgi:hypothetical protein
MRKVGFGILIGFANYALEVIIARVVVEPEVLLTADGDSNEKQQR